MSITIRTAKFTQLTPEPTSLTRDNLNLLLDVPLKVTVELGKTSKTIKEILDMNVGTVVELDKMAGEPVNIYVNGRFIAKGEIVVINEVFAVRVVEIIKTKDIVTMLGV